MRTRWVAIGVALLLGPGCSSGADRPPSAAPAPATAFTVRVPERFASVAAGFGSQQQVWGSDSLGSDQPTTVLGREDGTHAELVVRLTDFGGDQGGFDALVWGDDSTGVDDRPVGDDRARYVPDGDGRPATLAVERGDDLALVITGAGAARDELVDVAERTDVSAGRSIAPVVRPSAGERVLGSASAEGVMALRPFVAAPDRSGSEVPGGPRTYARAWWDRSARASLVVLAVPADALSIDVVRHLVAVRGDDELRVDAATVDGRAAVRMQRTFGLNGSTERYLVTTSSWGDRLVLVATAPTGVGASFEELAAVATSATPLD